MKKLTLLDFVLFFPCFFVFLANTVTSAAEEQKRPTIRAKVEVVDLVCTVRDGKGQYPENLAREDFQIYEDGKPQHLEFFFQEQGEKARPLSVVLLIDSSGSVKDKLFFEQKAAIEFFKNTVTENKDLAAVVQFDSEIRLVHDFSFDHSVLSKAILGIRAGGGTKLYDAIWVGVMDLLRSEVGRRILVVVSDGADTQSSISAKEASRIAQIHDVVIYGIGVKSQRFDSDFGRLKRFAQTTGGRFFNPRANLQRLRQAFSRISKEIKNQYSLGYISSNPKSDGTFRKIRVKINRSGLKVRHREGYYASTPGL